MPLTFDKGTRTFGGAQGPGPPVGRYPVWVVTGAPRRLGRGASVR